jgi:hypothetical protein
LFAFPRLFFFSSCEFKPTTICSNMKTLDKIVSLGFYSNIFKGITSKQISQKSIFSLIMWTIEKKRCWETISYQWLFSLENLSACVSLRLTNQILSSRSDTDVLLFKINHIFFCNETGIIWLVASTSRFYYCKLCPHVLL